MKDKFSPGNIVKIVQDPIIKDGHISFDTEYVVESYFSSIDEVYEKDLLSAERIERLFKNRGDEPGKAFPCVRTKCNHYISCAILKPVNLVVNDNLCICPKINFSYNGIGCICGGK